MNRAVFLALLLAVTASCKKPEPAAPSASDASSAPGSGPLTEIPDAIVVPDTGDMNATLGRLSMELRRYALRSKTSPKNYEQFAAQAHLQAPPPPPGKKYAISRGAVILADP